MSDSLVLDGISVSESGKVSDFSIPFILLNMIGGGLSWFLAMTWSNVFQSVLDDYKDKQEEKGKTINPVWLNLVMAVISTIFAIAVIYLMIKIYRKFQNTLKLNLNK